MARKKARKINLFFLSVILLFAALAASYYFNLTKFNNKNVGVRVSTVDEKTSDYKIKAEYPLFNQAERSFNKEIEQTVLTKIEQFKKNIQENKVARGPAGSTTYTLDINWQQDQINSRFISFILRMDSFEGGANQIQEIKTFNYDFSRKEVIKLSDLFPSKPDYLNNVSKFSKESLINQIQSNSGQDDLLQSMINDGTKIKDGSFSNFTFNDYYITFYFTKGEVAPAASGEQKVEMPRE